MIELLNLALPYFGLIFLGFACGHLRRIPETGLAWMDFFILYMALPALFYRVLAQTPLEQLNNVPFIIGTTATTALMLAASFIAAYVIRRSLAQATIAALAGAYGNIGYMGPGLALATFGVQAAAPVALIFCFETLLFFSFVPFFMALARPQGKRAGGLALEVTRKILLHPFDCDRSRRDFRRDPVRAAGGARPPDAVPAKRRRAVRAVHAWGDGGITAFRTRIAGGTGAARDQARASPGGRHADAECARAFRSHLGRHRDIDGGLASRAQCVRPGAAVR